MATQETGEKRGRGRMPRVLRGVFIACVAAMGVVVVVGAVRRLLGAAHVLGLGETQFLLSFAGLAGGALFGEILLRTGTAHPRIVAAGGVAHGLALLSFLLLLWTDWKTQTFLWRSWWISMVTGVTITHLLALRHLSTRSKDILERGTFVCALLASILVLSLALRRELLSQITVLYWWLLSFPAATSLAGTAILWRRWRRRTRGPSEARPLSRSARIAVIVVTHLVIFAVGLYLGRVYSPRYSPTDILPSALAGLSEKEIQTRVETDLRRLRVITAGIDELEVDVDAFRIRVRERMEREGRKIFLQEEDDQIRRYFRTYLAYRAALLRMVAVYAGFQSVPEPSLRARCFLVGYGAATTLLQSSLKLVRTFRQRPEERRKLNEEEPLWGIPAGMFDRIYENVATKRNAELFEEMAVYYEHRRAEWRQAAVFDEADAAWLERRIAGGIEYVRANALDPLWANLKLLKDRVMQDAYTPIYAVQSMTSTWIGDTRIVEREPFVGLEQIEREIQPQLRPGDILLERRNWFLSNAFLPGFWPHAALYVGTIGEIRALDERLDAGERILEDPVVKGKLARFLEPAHDGRPHTVIESVSEGVIFNSLTHSMHADYVAALRPRLADREIARAIRRAFAHEGKPYDFEFDFGSTDKLVCTELVYRSYAGMIDFETVEILGRRTLPANRIVGEFREERDTPGARLEFVLFYDTLPGASGAGPASEDAFCQSMDRSRAFNE